MKRPRVGILIFPDVEVLDFCGPFEVFSVTRLDEERRREEVDWMLNAIVGAIVTGKLPPDDACAWAKIAAHEVELLGLTPAPVALAA